MNLIHNQSCKILVWRFIFHKGGHHIFFSKGFDHREIVIGEERDSSLSVARGSGVLGV